MHRFFGGKKIRSFFWDGVTNYTITSDVSQKIEEEEKQEASRLDEFGDWLDNVQEELPGIGFQNYLNCKFVLENTKIFKLFYLI